MKKIFLLVTIFFIENITAQVSIIDKRIISFECKGLKFGLKETEFLELYSNAEITDLSKPFFNKIYNDIVTYKYFDEGNFFIECTFERGKLLNSIIGFLTFGDDLDKLRKGLENYFEGNKGENVDLSNLNLYGKGWFYTDSIRVIMLIYDDSQEQAMIYMEEIKSGLYLMQEEFELNEFEISVEDVYYKTNISNDFFNETADGIFACIDMDITNIANENKMLNDLNIYLVLLINDIEYKYEPSFDPSYILNSTPNRFLLGMDDIPPLIPIKTTLVFEIPSKKNIMFLSFHDKSMKERRCAVRVRK